MQGKILVARGGALGDFILTLPVLDAVRRRFPEHRLEILGYPGIAALATESGLADAVTGVESPLFTGFFLRDGVLAREACEFFAGFEWVISYLYDPEGIFRRNVARCSSARFVAGPHRPDDFPTAHATETLLRPLREMGIANANPRPCLNFSAIQSIRFTWALHPGSGSERKNWPEMKWDELLGCIMAETSDEVLLIGGEAEEGRCARLASGHPAERIQIAQDLPLPELARRMKDCAAFAGHDSGITHLAAALGLPGVVLWGETNLMVWRPSSERMKILRGAGGLGTLALETVWRKLQSLRTG